MTRKRNEVIDYSWASDYWRQELLAQARLVCKIAAVMTDDLGADDVVGFFAHFTMLDALVGRMRDGAGRGIVSASPRGKESQMTRLLLKALEK